MIDKCNVGRWSKIEDSENFRMVARLDRVVNWIGSVLINIAAFTLAVFESALNICVVFFHRLVIAIRETTGHIPFEPLTKTPRHVCLVIGRPVTVPDVDQAVRTILATGVERVTVCHDGSLSLSGEMYTESVTNDMGRSSVVDAVRSGLLREESSQPDAILILSKNPCPTRFSMSALQLPKCVDASLLAYPELLPVYSLHPSDVFLAVSMFQSKSQRFGR